MPQRLRKKLPVKFMHYDNQLIGNYLITCQVPDALIKKK